MSETAQLPIDETADTTAKLRALLRRKYPADQYAMLYEVRDAAGFQAQRSADVIVVGLWPSRGCLLEGMELKVSRSDWLRELKKPQKAEAFFSYCDRWWVVVGSSDIVKPGELPPTWGLMVPRAGGLGVIQQAPVLKPEPIDRSLLAAMMKRATSTALEDPQVCAVIDARVAAQKALLKSNESYDLQRLKRDLEDLRKSVSAFQQASGVQIDAYSGARIGEAVRAVMSGEHRHRLSELRHIKDRARSLLQWMEQNIPDDAAGLEGSGVKG